MASTTSKLGLTKPASGEAYSIDVVNQNMQKIDDFAADLTRKTTHRGTANSNYISALEGQIVRNGSVVSGYFVLTVNADFSAASIQLISNLPAAYNQDVQLPCIGLSGTNINKASRVKITTSGTIVTWYGFSFKSGEAYLIPVNYICA